MVQYKSSLVPKDYGAKETMESLGAKVNARAFMGGIAKPTKFLTQQVT